MYLMYYGEGGLVNPSLSFCTRVSNSLIFYL